MTLPNFLIIGAQKSGTTWLAWKLRQHPSVFMPMDEVHFFDREDNFAKGLGWYQAHFDKVATETAVGEKTPDYLAAGLNGLDHHTPDLHHRIYETLPDVKLIVSLRNPVERTVSATYHMIRTGHISPFHNIDDLLAGSKQHVIHQFGVIEYGKYFQQLKTYLQYFDRHQILVLIFEEDIIGRPGSGLKKVCQFLEIDPTFPFAELQKKDNAYRHSWPGLVLDYYIPALRPISARINRIFPVHKPKLNPNTVQNLYELYEPYNRELYEWLGYKPVTWTRDIAKSKSLVGAINETR